jgi:nucleoid-associated protein YgaU
MKLQRLLLLITTISLLLVAMTLSVWAQQMTKDQWQEEIKANTTRKADLQNALIKLDSDIKDLQAQSDKLDADLKTCQQDLYSLLGNVTPDEFNKFLDELTQTEKRVSELQAMSDDELLKNKDEVMRIDSRLKEMAQSKIALIPNVAERIKNLQDKVAGLIKSLSISKEKTYTVGTWARNHDCLWNIAKKKDIYDKAWLWPKIWQGNRDKIKDPDVIRPKWVLRIPEGNELSKQEKSAANSYYRKKAAAPAGGAGN